jgi:hypothetical protein
MPLGLGVDHLDRIVVPHAYQDMLAVLGQGDAARPLTDLDVLHDLELRGIDHRDRVAFLVRHVGEIGLGPGDERDDERDPEQTCEPHCVRPLLVS